MGDLLKGGRSSVRARSTVPEDGVAEQETEDNTGFTLVSGELTTVLASGAEVSTGVARDRSMVSEADA